MFQKDHSKSSVDNALDWPGGVKCEAHTKAGMMRFTEDTEVRYWKTNFGIGEGQRRIKNKL